MVTASNANGESGNSEPGLGHARSRRPPPPTGLSATPGNTQVALSWTASAGATSYTVKRSPTAGGPYTNFVRRC